MQVFTKFTNRRQFHTTLISVEPAAQMSDFRGSLPEAHRSHNGLFLVVIINIGREREEDENVAPAKKQLPSIPYSLTYKMCYFQRNEKRDLPPNL